MVYCKQLFLSMEFLAILVGLALLIQGGDWLMKAAVGLSLHLKIPKIVIGMTVVSFATSAPELIVSMQASLSGYPDLALGNVMGSNVANLAFVLSIVILITPIKVSENFVKTDWSLMFFMSLLFYFMLSFDAVLSRVEGLILVLFLIAFLLFLIKFQKKEVSEETEGTLEAIPINQLFWLLPLGGFSLWLGSETLVKGAVTLAQQLGVSERIISISIISVGTSIPELSASLVAIANKEKAISLGNLIGSNIFNILAVLGLTALVQPLEINDLSLIHRDIYWMLGISFLIMPLVFFPKKMTLGRYEGIILLSAYVLFLYPLIFD